MHYLSGKWFLFSQPANQFFCASRVFAQVRGYNKYRIDFSKKNWVSSLEDNDSLKERVLFVNDFLEKVFDEFNNCNELQDNFRIQEMLCKICVLIPSRTIEFKQKYISFGFSNIYQDIWERLGFSYSKEPEFFEAVWDNITYQKGFVESRRSLIQRCAANCGMIPDKIINDLSEKGHHSNKLDVIQLYLKKIKINNTVLRKLEPDSLNAIKLKEENEYCVAKCFKFVNDKNIGVVELIIPVLNESQLLFAAPNATKLGLTGLVAAHLKKFTG